MLKYFQMMPAGYAATVISSLLQAILVTVIAGPVFDSHQHNSADYKQNYKQDFG